MNFRPIFIPVLVGFVAEEKSFVQILSSDETLQSGSLLYRYLLLLSEKFQSQSQKDPSIRTVMARPSHLVFLRGLPVVLFGSKPLVSS